MKNQGVAYAIRAVLRPFADGFPTLQLNDVGTFAGDENVVYLTVAKTEELLTLQQKIHDELVTRHAEE